MTSVGGVCTGPSLTGKTSRVIVVDDDEALLRTVTVYLSNNDNPLVLRPVEVI